MRGRHTDLPQMDGQMRGYLIGPTNNEYFLRDVKPRRGSATEIWTLASRNMYLTVKPYSIKQNWTRVIFPGSFCRYRRKNIYASKKILCKRVILSDLVNLPVQKIIGKCISCYAELVIVQSHRLAHMVSGHCAAVKSCLPFLYCSSIAQNKRSVLGAMKSFLTVCLISCFRFLWCLLFTRTTQIQKIA